MGKKYNKTPIKGGSGKERVFANGGSVIQVTVKESSIAEMGTFVTSKGEKCYQFHIAKRREADDYGNTHWLYRLDIEDDGEEETPKTDWSKDDGSTSPDNDMPF